MQFVKLNKCKRYSYKGVIYESGGIYCVSDDLAEDLLNKKDEADMPYFAVATKADREGHAPKAVADKVDDGAASPAAARGRRTAKVTKKAKGKQVGPPIEGLDTPIKGGDEGGKTEDDGDDGDEEADGDDEGTGKTVQV